MRQFCLLFAPVCDDTCREVILDPNDLLMVCKISGRCFENLMAQAETESDSVSISFLHLHLFTWQTLPLPRILNHERLNGD